MAFVREREPPAARKAHGVHVGQLSRAFPGTAPRRAVRLLESQRILVRRDAFVFTHPYYDEHRNAIEREREQNATRRKKKKEDRTVPPASKLVSRDVDEAFLRDVHEAVARAGATGLERTQLLRAFPRRMPMRACTQLVSRGLVELRGTRLIALDEPLAATAATQASPATTAAHGVREDLQDEPPEAAPNTNHTTTDTTTTEETHDMPQATAAIERAPPAREPLIQRVVNYVRDHDGAQLHDLQRAFPNEKVKPAIANARGAGRLTVTGTRGKYRYHVADAAAALTRDAQRVVHIDVVEDLQHDAADADVHAELQDGLQLLTQDELAAELRAALEDFQSAREAAAAAWDRYCTLARAHLCAPRSGAVSQ